MFLLISLFLLPLWSQERIICTHPQVCNLFPNSTYPLKLEIDPHHFEPSIGDIKKFLMADVVAIGPLSLNPWAIKIKKNRESSRKKIIEISIPEKFKEKYGKKNSYMLDHFWLFPDILCSLVKDCQEKEANERIEKLKGLIKGKYFVLTHDALSPLLESLGANVASLRTSTHNCEAQPSSLKIIEDWKKKNRAIIWLIEENVHTFNQLKGKIGKDDITLKIDIVGKPGEDPFKVFDKLLLELEKTINDKPTS